MTRPTTGISTAPASEARPLSRPAHRPRLRPSTMAMKIASMVQPSEANGTTIAATSSTAANPRAAARHKTGRISRRRRHGVVGSSRKLMTVSRPLHCGRHRREDRVDIAAGLEAEDGAAVVEQVELDVAAAPHELLLALVRAPGLRHVSPHQRRIDAQERAPDLLREGEIRVPVR